MEDLISRAERLASTGDWDGAMSLASELVAKYPNEMKVWLLRADLYGRNRAYASAIADLSRAIEISPMEPCLFHERGLDALALGNDQAATEDFTRGLELCDRQKSDYYRESFHFLRAEAFLRLRRKKEALADLAHVREDQKAWTYRLRTKAELLYECNSLDD